MEYLAIASTTLSKKSTQAAKSSSASGKRRKKPIEIIKKLSAQRPAIQKQIPPHLFFPIIEKDAFSRVILAHLYIAHGGPVPLPEIYRYIASRYGIPEHSARTGVLRRSKLLFTLGLIQLLPPMRPFFRSYAAIYYVKKENADVLSAFYAKLVLRTIEDRVPLAEQLIDPIEEKAVGEFLRARLGMKDYLEFLEVLMSGDLDDYNPLNLSLIRDNLANLARGEI